VFSHSLCAQDNHEIIEQGADSYYFSSVRNTAYMKALDPFNVMLDGQAMGGTMTRARTKCYFKQLDPNVRCPDYIIGHATMKTGIPRTTICNAAKRAVTAPRGCQRKHCTPCVYDKP